ncbi:MAG: hypothetical protein M3Q75_03370 [Gemmatimonadota bacterium]|nr:hypothetical protein [Gemmatimonadota bacterium]
MLINLHDVPVAPAHEVVQVDDLAFQINLLCGVQPRHPLHQPVSRVERVAAYVIGLERF